MRQRHPQRPWSSIILDIDHGYFGGYPAYRITCDQSGDLHFERIDTPLFGPKRPLKLEHHQCTEKGLTELDKLVEQIRALEGDLYQGDMMDGPSFACRIELESGLFCGFQYVSRLLRDDVGKIEKGLRRWMRESYFLRKNEEVLDPLFL